MRRAPSSNPSLLSSCHGTITRTANDSNRIQATDEEEWRHATLTCALRNPRSWYHGRLGARSSAACDGASGTDLQSRQLHRHGHTAEYFRHPHEPLSLRSRRAHQVAQPRRRSGDLCGRRTAARAGARQGLARRRAGNHVPCRARCRALAWRGAQREGHHADLTELRYDELEGASGGERLQIGRCLAPANQGDACVAPTGTGLLLFELIALVLQQREQSIGADEMRGADDDEARLRLCHARFDLRYPVVVALDDERRIRTAIAVE